jgi:hypothetical protein
MFWRSWFYQAKTEMRHPRALVLPVPVQVGLVPVGFPARVALVFP